MAEKGAPRAANAPNQTQMRGAPMSLRSAMQKYAVGGGVGSPPPSSGDINNFVQANIGNPQAIMQAAQQYGVSMDDLANATGYSSSQINDYFGNAGLGSFDARPIPPQVAGSGTFNVPPPSSIPPTIMPDEGLNEPALDEGYGYGAIPDYREKEIDTSPMPSRNSYNSQIPSASQAYSNITPEMLQQLMQRSNDPFGTQIDRNDELMQLLQILKANK